MFDQYIIDPASVRNTGPADAPTGFAFTTKLGYCRGLGLSMVEDLAVAIDGAPVPRAAIRFDEGPGPLTLEEMETVYDRRWAFGQSGRLFRRLSQWRAPLVSAADAPHFLHAVSVA